MPGLIVLMELYPLASKYFPSSINEIIKIETSILIGLCIGLGAVYQIFSLRDIVVQFTGHTINENIKRTLLNIYGRPITDQQTKYLKDDRRLLNIFYDFVDHDSSLSAKSKNIYFNGLFWSTTADLVVISILLGFIYVTLGVFSLNSKDIIGMGYLLIAFGLLSLILHQLTLKEHLKLSNQQLEVIRMKYANQLTQLLDVVLQQMP